MKNEIKTNDKIDRDINALVPFIENPDIIHCRDHGSVTCPTIFNVAERYYGMLKESNNIYTQDEYRYRCGMINNIFKDRVIFTIANIVKSIYVTDKHLTFYLAGCVLSYITDALNDYPQILDLDQYINGIFADNYNMLFDTMVSIITRAYRYNEYNLYPSFTMCIDSTKNPKDIREFADITDEQREKEIKANAYMYTLLPNTLAEAIYNVAATFKNFV